MDNAPPNEFTTMEVLIQRENQNDLVNNMTTSWPNASKHNKVQRDSTFQ